MIKNWLAEYKPVNQKATIDALREIMQEIALAGLYRAGFFEKAAFYGGAALRIFYGLDRFSEDLDFSLLQPDRNFTLDKYTKAVQEEFESLGMTVSVTGKKKSGESQVESAFLKSETLWKELVLEDVVPQTGLDQKVNIKIKIEVDKTPPGGFETEQKLLLRPFSFYVKCFTRPYLFAGKVHALLFRKWKDNVKGRDWYDFEWYIKNNIPLALDHFKERAKESNDLPEGRFTEIELRQLLKARFDKTAIDRVKTDVARFIPNSSRLDIWSAEYFNELALRLKVI
ncbi:MAG TPA: nucleotidyl transferase AbiEii/AbiGii toxin family protein [Cyclobacteriaceae bacterium]|nr:nucleotidyl transferase AbiEii/AbiGii toxin family protein [Cyclobacteriaceae bacterium]